MTRIKVTHNDGLTILRFLHEHKHLTSADIHRYILCGYTKRTVERRLQYLLDQGFIASTPLHPHLGGRSPRLYHLLLKGAREIGYTSLGNHHYRFKRPDFYRYDLGLIEAQYLARTEDGWALYQSEQECQQALYQYLVQKRVPDASLLMPPKIVPDALLWTGDGLNIFIRAHPHCGRGFFLTRCKQYTALLDKCRAVIVVLDVYQAREAKAVIKGLGLDGRVLVTNLEDLRKLPLLVHRSRQRGEGETLSERAASA